VLAVPSLGEALPVCQHMQQFPPATLIKAETMIYKMIGGQILIQTAPRSSTR
jgi:hypothetical protein